MSLELNLVGENHCDPRYSERVIEFLDCFKPDIAAFESDRIYHYYTHPELLNYCKNTGIKFKSIDLVTNIHSLMILLDNPFGKSWRDLIFDKSLMRSEEEIRRLLSKKSYDKELYYEPLERMHRDPSYNSFIDLIVKSALRERLMSWSLRRVKEGSITAFVGVGHLDSIQNHLRDLNPNKYFLYEADSLSKPQALQTLEAYA